MSDVAVLGFTLTSNGVSVVIKSEGSIEVLNKHGADPELIELLKDPNGNAEKIAKLMRPMVQNLDSLGGGFVRDGSCIALNGWLLPDVLAMRIIRYIDQGVDASRLKNFVSKLVMNPSRTAINELILFLESGDFTLTEDGDFLAYKAVRHDYKDCRTGKNDNSVGKTVSMQRMEVDDVRDRTCSYGLHFCSFGYIGSFMSGDNRLMLVKINPMNVVSIPSDYSNTKGRCCEYEVVADVTEEYHKQRACFLEKYNDEFGEEWEGPEDKDWDSEDWCDSCEMYEYECEC